LEALIREKMESGKYGSPIEVVRAGLRLLDREEKLGRIRAMIAEADAQVAGGETFEYTPELREEMDRELEESLLRGDKPNPDVCP
jgi:putative addiction module CopG family antidote